MSLSSATNRNDYTGNGAVNTYSYSFRIFAEGDLLVTVRDTDDVESTLTITTDYTVTGVGDASGGTVVLVNSGQDWLDGDGDLKSSYALTIRRVVDVIQETDIRNQGVFYPESHEDAFDYLTMIDQQQQDELDRSVKNPETISNSTFDPELPADVTTANYVLGVNSSGNGFEMKSSDDLMSLAGALLIANNLSDLASVGTALVNLGIAPLSVVKSLNFTDGMLATDVTGLTFDGTLANIVKLEYGINQGSGTKLAQGHITLTYDGSNWALQTGPYTGTAAHDLTFSFTESGTNNKDVQVRVATAAGSGTGSVGFKSHTFLQA